MRGEGRERGEGGGVVGGKICLKAGDKALSTSLCVTRSGKNKRTIARPKVN